MERPGTAEWVAMQEEAEAKQTVQSAPEPGAGSSGGLTPGSGAPSGPEPGGSPSPGEGTGVPSDAERARRLSDLQSLIDLMRPAVQADGGDLLLVSADVEGVVEVQLQGACSSCAISSATLQGGVERILKDRLPWVTEVLGDLDESIDPFESAAMGRGGYVPGL
jgi:Fe-S cluster biogenesis protein NfuA